MAAKQRKVIKVFGRNQVLPTLSHYSYLGELLSKWLQCLKIFGLHDQTFDLAVESKGL